MKEFCLYYYDPLFTVLCLSQHILCCFTEAGRSAGTVSVTVEVNREVQHQNPEEESNVAVAAPDESSDTCPDQDAPKEPTATSSPDTDSPVMISVDVSEDNCFNDQDSCVHLIFNCCSSVYLF